MKRSCPVPGAKSSDAGQPMARAGRSALPLGTTRVIIPARQAASHIGACIEAARAAGFPTSQIVVVDDGSTDATRHIAERAGARVIVNPERTGAARSRNIGARDAGGDILVFVDADVEMAPDAPRVIAGTFSDCPEVAAVFGSYDARPSAPGTVSRFRNLLHRHVHQENAGEAQTFWTGLGAVRRDAFEAVGGFDPDQRMMEDVQFGIALVRAGARIRLEPKLLGRHRKRWTLTSMIRSDLLDRAIPWSRLLRSDGMRLPATLNLSWTGRVSVILTFCMLLAAPVAPFAPAAAAIGSVALLLGLAGANRRFLRRLRREAGPRLMLAAVPLLAIHYLCGGLGYAWVLLTPARATGRAD